MPKTIEDLIAQVEAAISAEEGRSEEQSRAFAGVDERLAELQAELEAERARRETIEQELQLQVVGQTMQEIHSFADGLVGSGRVPPSLKGKVEALLSVAANLDGEVKSYALGDVAEGGEDSPYKLLCDLLSELPQVGTLRSTAKTPGAAQGERGRPDVRRFANNTDAAEALHAEVKRIQKDESISYLQAFEKAKKLLLDAQG